MCKLYALLMYMAIAMHVSAQLNESFSDGNFTLDPVWNSSAGSWQIVTDSDVGAGANGSNTLRLNVASGGGVAWLSTQITGSWQQEQSWGYFVGRRGQSFTSSNHTLIWLWCSEADPTSVTADGYRIRIGDDAGGDEIMLQRVTNGVAADILVGPALANGLTDIGFLLRVTRSAAGVWQLFTSVLPAASGGGAVATDVPNAMNAGVLQGSVIDNVYVLFDDGWLGFVSVFSSSVPARVAQEFDNVMLSFAGAALPVKLEQFEAVAEGSLVRLWWQVTEEQGVDLYQVQRSDDGLHFIVLGNVNAEQRKNYSFTDEAPLNGEAFYRLRILDDDGTEWYSRVVRIKQTEAVKWKVWPNPVRSVLNVVHPPGNIKIINAAGVVVLQTMSSQTGITQLNLSSLPAGIYYLAGIPILKN